VISYEWRGSFTNAEVAVLHAEVFGCAFSGVTGKACIVVHNASLDPVLRPVPRRSVVRAAAGPPG